MANTNKEINTIYEYGNYNLEIESYYVTLLLFNALHIININERKVNLNARYQYYICLDESFYSPEKKMI